MNKNRFAEHMDGADECEKTTRKEGRMVILFKAISCVILCGACIFIGFSHGRQWLYALPLIVPYAITYAFESRAERRYQKAMSQWDRHLGAMRAMNEIGEDILNQTLEARSVALRLVKTDRGAS